MVRLVRVLLAFWCLFVLLCSCGLSFASCSSVESWQSRWDTDGFVHLRDSLLCDCWKGVVWGITVQNNRLPPSARRGVPRKAG